jgi:hypothetical protein
VTETSFNHVQEEHDEMPHGHDGDESRSGNVALGIAAVVLGGVLIAWISRVEATITSAAVTATKVERVERDISDIARDVRSLLDMQRDQQKAAK